MEKKLRNYVKLALREIEEKRYDLDQPALLQVTNCRLNGKPAKQIAIYFRTTICKFALRGECSMCGYHYNTIGNGKKQISVESILNQFNSAYERMKNQFPVIAMYNSGSMLDQRQMPEEALHEILTILDGDEMLEKIVIESRPEFIRKESISKIRKVAGKKRIEVGLGLESATDLVREKIINKRFTRSLFERAVKILKENDIEILAYILFKPPLLTEREAIEDAINTTEYTFKVGANRVIIETLFIEHGTLVETLHFQGAYELPWLWGVLEVLKKVHHIGDVAIGYPDDSPKPCYIAQNCPRCTEQFYNSFDQYNMSGDLTELNSLSCHCKEEWIKKLSYKETCSLEERYEAFLKSYIY